MGSHWLLADDGSHGRFCWAIASDGGAHERWVGFRRLTNQGARCRLAFHTGKEYHETAALLDSLIDEVGEDETHLLAAWMDILEVMIEKREDDLISKVAEI